MKPFPPTLVSAYPILPAPPEGAVRLREFCAETGLRFCTIVKALRAGRCRLRAFRVMLPRARRDAAVPQWSWWVAPGVKPEPSPGEKKRCGALWCRVERDVMLGRGVFAAAVLAEIADYCLTFRTVLPTPPPSAELLRRGEALSFERLAMFVRAAALTQIYPLRKFGAPRSLRANQARLNAANALLASVGIPWRGSLTRWHT